MNNYDKKMKGFSGLGRDEIYLLKHKTHQGKDQVTMRDPWVNVGLVVSWTSPC